MTVVDRYLESISSPKVPPHPERLLLEGLYQASSATHAGGGVTGLPGHHCVREIVKDRKARGKRKR